MPATATPEIFANVPKTDRLNLFQGGQPRYESVAGLLSFDKRDVAKAIEDVSVSQVRYDAHIPPVVAERMHEWALLLDLVGEHFAGDAERTALWFKTANPMLGNVAPRDMVRFGLHHKLQAFILHALAENKR